MCILGMQYNAHVCKVMYVVDDHKQVNKFSEAMLHVIHFQSMRTNQ